MRYKLFLLLLVLTTCLSGLSCRRVSDSLPPEPPENSATDQQNAASPNPSGIKDDYTNTDRVIWQKPEVVIDLLGDVRDKVIADIGAGTGFFALRLAPMAKKVIAIDIDRQFVNYLDSVRRKELPLTYQSRLEPRLAKPDNPMLAPGEADVVMIVNTYMYLNNRVAYLRNLKKALRSSGRVLIIDFKKKKTSLGPPSEIRIPQFQVEEELEAAGFHILESNDTALDFQYIILAEK